MQNSEKINFSSIKHNKYIGLLIDLAIYISVMFLVREIYFSEIGFIANGLFWSFTTLIVASWRMKIRDVSWLELGLNKPKNIGKTLGVSAIIIVSIIFFIVILNVVLDHLPFQLAPDTSSENAVSRFGNLKGNWTRFFAIIFFIWVESMLEEMLDRGFLMNWIEKLFSFSSYSVVFAVILQAMLFGFRHSSDISERSLTVGIIGLIMGIAYYKFGRNLWPLIIAHCVLNSMSMVERVL